MDLELAPSGSASPTTSEAAPGAEDSSWSADLANNPAADESAMTSPPATTSQAGTEDTNAVVSHSHADFLLTRIAAAFVALPPAVPYVGLVGLGTVVAFNTYQAGEVSALTRVFDVCAWTGASVVVIGGAFGLLPVVL